jgi:CheY-like chemotaxis protein
VLIVDDDPGFRGLARRLLVDAGLTVDAEAGDALEALAAAHAARPDGVLVDVGLPGRDGLDLALELRALAWAPRVLLTSTDPEAGAPAAAAGLPFVAKEELADAPLRKLLGG